MKGNSENLDGVGTSNITQSIDRDKGIFYALTIKPMFTSLRKTIGQDQDLFESWYQSYCYSHDLIAVRHSYERDTHNILHIHAIVCIPQRIEYRVYNKSLEVKGLSIWIVRRRNQRWDQYIDKGKDNSTCREYYTQNYGFILDINQ